MWELKTDTSRAKNITSSYFKSRDMSLRKLDLLLSQIKNIYRVIVKFGTQTPINLRLETNHILNE